MRKLLLFTILAILSLNMSAQGNEAWEAAWSGYQTESRGIRWFTVLKDPNLYVAWSVAYDGSGNGDDICALGVTTDGGYTWTTYDPASLEGAVNPGISMVFPTTSTTAYLAAYKRPGSMGDGGLWKTVDGGATWTRINTSSMYTDANSFPNLIYFFDKNNGFSQGDPLYGEFEMYYTTDAGATWTPIDGANIDDPLAGEYGYTNGYAAAGSTVWFTTNKGRIFRSTDQGHTWTAFQTPLTDFGGQADGGNITFANDNDGWIQRRNGELYQTTDGGETWTLMNPTDFNAYGTDIAYIPGTTNTLIASEADYNLPDYGTRISYDGGQTWTKILKYKFSFMTDYDDLGNILQDADGNPVENFQHTALGFRDMSFGLSGNFSYQDDPNSDTDLGDLGVFIFHNDYMNNISTDKVAELQVYPNPAKDVVNVMTKNNIKNISVYDVTGKEVIHLNNLDLNNARVDVSGLEKGIYLMKIVDNKNAQETIKLVVK